MAIHEQVDEEVKRKLLLGLVEIGRHMSQAAVEDIYDPDPFEIFKMTEAALYRLFEDCASGRDVVSFYNAGGTALETLEKSAFGAVAASKATGIAALDSVIGGLRDGELVLLAGCPGVGKTSLASSIAFNAARRFSDDLSRGIEPHKSRGAIVGFFSLKTSAAQLATSILAQATGVNVEALHSERISRSDLMKTAELHQRSAELPLYFRDGLSLSIASLRTQASWMKRRHGVRLIIVDDLQMMQGTCASDSLENQRAEVIRGLKILAGELSVPIVALFQVDPGFNAPGEKRARHVGLQLGEIVDACTDMVWFLNREDDILNGKAAHIAELLVSWQRRSTLEAVRLHFDTRSTKFADWVENADDTERKHRF